MKNFLSKLWSLSRTDRVRTLAIDAVSLPSFCRVNMLKLVSVLVILLTIGSGNVWGTEEVIYTLTPYDTGSDGTSTGYGSATDASCEDEDADITITWNVTGNTNMVPWRIGGKGGKGTTSTYDRVIYSKNAISNDVTKIVITHGAASSITVNSMTVVVSTAQNGGGTVTSTLTPTFAANGDVTINRPAGKDWSGKYYKINYNVSINGDKNKFLEFSQAKFYADVSSCEKIGAPTVTATPGDRQISLSWPNQSEASSYTVTCTGGTPGAVTGTTTKSCTITGLTNGTSYTWTVTPVGDGSTSCTDGNTAASASATPNVYYTVTWKNNGSSYTTTSVASGQKPTFPDNPSSCDGTSTTFYGWSTSEWSGTVDALGGKTVYTAASSMPTVSAAVSYYAVFAKKTTGSETSVTGGTFSDAVTTQTGWTGSGVGTYSGNGVKFDGANDYIQSPDISSNSLKEVTVKYKAGHNGGSGSVLTFASLDGSGNVIDSKTATPSQAYNSQTTTYSLTLSGASIIKYVRVTMTSKTNNLGMKYCQIYYTPVTYSKYLTTCCTGLGSINGSVSWSNAATAVVSWDNLDHVSSWTVKYKTHAAGAYTTWAGEQSTAAGRRSVTITGLTPYTNYDFQIIANPASGYCDKDQTIEDSQTHNWTVTKTGVTNVTAASLSAIPATTCASGFGPITITAATGYALPADITVTNATKSWNSSTGALSISSVTGNVSITITPTCVPPVVTGNPADANYYVGDAPTALSVTATLASGTRTYLWKVSTNGGSTWSDATGTNNAATYSGASLSTASVGTLKFKCIVGNSEGGCTVESEEATITVANASYFPNGKTIFIQAESSSAWSDANYDCVKAWFHTAGGSETAQTTYWLFDATGGDAGKKLFATVVPATGDLPYLDIQRFTHDCSSWRNKNGGCSYSDANGSNTIRSTGNTDTYDAKDDYIRWNVSGVTIDLYGDPSDDDWASSLASFSDQGAGVWTATYNNYAPADADGESQDFKVKTNYNGWIGNTGSNTNATLDGMHVGSTYNITATLDVTDHSLTMSKTYVKGTVHFDLQGHGSSISDLTNVTAGSTISAPSAPSADGWTFGGWYREPACTNAWTFASDVVNETMTLYAKWTRTPVITVSETSRAFGTKKVDGSYTMTFTVSGVYLQGNIGLAISGTNAAMFSVDETSLTPSDGSVSSTTITVTYTPSTAAAHSATVSITSTNATTKTVTLSGTGQYEDTYMTAMHEGITAWTSYAAGVTKAGTGYEVPNPGDIAAGDREGTGCEGIHYHFAGWVEESYKASPSGHIVAASGTKDASNKTFWAVWEKEKAGSAGAAANTVLWAEDFSGWGDGDVPGGDDITNSHTGTTVYGSATLTYACVNGGSNTKLYGGNNTLYAGGSAPELLVGKNTGSFTVSGIPNGGASEITVSYKQNNKALTVAASGTGYSGSATNTPASATTESFDVTVGSDATFTLTFTPSTDNVRIDDISVKVKTQGITYEDPKVECICSANPVAGTAAVDTEGTFSASSIAVKATGASTGHADCSYTDYGFVWSSSVTTPTLVEGTGAASDNCEKEQVGTDGQVTTFAGSITGSFTANNPIYVRSYVKNGKAEGTYQYSSVVTITPRSVTFNLNGHGSSAPASQFVNNGSKATDPSYSESVTGYIFGGWYKEAGCSNAWTLGTDVVSGESKTLYAKWTPISYSVRFNDNDENYLGTATGSMSNQSFDYDEEKALTTNAFSLAGYDFAGWALTADGDVAHLDEAEVENLSSTNGATVDLYAIWTAKSYDVTLAATDETSSVGNQTVTVTYNDDMPTVKKGGGAVAAPTRTGYTFTGWEYSSTTYYDYNAGTSTLSSAHVWDQPNSTTTLTPKWSINSYTLTWNLAGGTVSVAGTGAAEGATGTPSSSVVYNSAITAPTVTKAGYNFAGWDVTPASNMPASDVTYTATWTAKTLNSISLAEASISVYVGEIKYVDVIFDPTDILSKAFGQVAAPSYCVLNSYDSYNKLKITGGRAGADISVNRTETVSIKYTADETKTASISVTVKPLPTVTFVDLIHNKSDFANSSDGWTAGTGVLSSTVSTGVVSHDKKTPTHTDVSAPVGGNACETGHLHLMGWIRSDYEKVAAYMAGTGAAPTVSELTSAGTGYWFLPDADINVETYDGKTFYAVWAVEE